MAEAPGTDHGTRRDREETERRLADLKDQAAREFRRLHPDTPPLGPTDRPRPRKPRRRLPSWRWAVKWLGIAVVVVAGPFLVLVRTSVVGYRTLEWGTWGSLALGTSATVVVVGLLAGRLLKKTTGKARYRVVLTRVALPLVLAYSVYGMIFLSASNAKSERIRNYYREVHPIFRLALATATLGDPGLVVTDLGRTPADYLAMGLPTREVSLHYRQVDGYVHAADLRTIGRPVWRTALLILYFRAMGFRTLRHVGTADHLHVSLPNRRTDG